MVVPSCADRPLQHRTVVITGSTRGIGLIMAQAMAEAGSNVVISSRSQGAIAAVLPQLQAIPQAQVLGVPCDITDFDQVQQLGQRTLDRFGSVDVWFNNAATTCPFGPVLDIPMAQWRQVIETNVIGTYHGTTVALERMLPQGRGTIINLLGAGTNDTANGYLSAYTASKAAVQRFTQVAADDYKDSGIKVCGFNPGLVPTDLTLKIHPLNAEAQRRLQILKFGLRWLSTDPTAIASRSVSLAIDSPDIKSGHTYRCFPSVALRLQRAFSAQA
ncbi:SDR family NAD(P)-dependent oxidoreductase [Prochlorothrix hollandica]|uniref:SDR family NAD(P)-dependent oxidoreductase n=1 Tax=Prochlorothrix hollandica TaxID=1223 RepID=UPI00034D7D3C|nr:SDR family oxidoreductase [Prochlorothrix hollandica]